MAVKVVFVCTGNTCRSVMAHYWLQGHCAAQGVEVAVDSCGVNPTVGKAPAANGVAILTQEGYPEAVAKHSAQAADDAMLASAQHIVCMTAAHRDIICERFPHHAEKASTLLTCLGTRDHICVEDPVGQSLEVYRQCFEIMKPALTYIAGQV